MSAQGEVITGGNCYWGPDATVYGTDSASSVNTNEIVTVHWLEGSYYYIEYNTSTATKRMYYPKSLIQITSGTVPTFTLPAGLDQLRYVIDADKTRYAPTSNSAAAGSLNKSEPVRYTGEKVGDYALVIYDISGGKKKRAWFPHMSLTYAPTPSPSTVYASTSSISAAQKTANAKYIYNYLLSLGFTKSAACAVLGNMEAESGINPGIWQVTNSLSDGYGLVQWTPATNFLNRAYDYGTLNAKTASAVNTLASSDPKSLMDAQLECVLYSCGSSGAWLKPSGSMQHTNYSMTFNEFMASSLTADTLAIVFHDHYERSAASASTLQTGRAAMALQWYNTL